MTHSEQWHCFIISSSSLILLTRFLKIFMVSDCFTSELSFEDSTGPKKLTLFLPNVTVLTLGMETSEFLRDLGLDS